MSPILAFIVFPIALALLVVSANHFLANVRKIGITLGVRPFIIGSFVVAFGTSFPEAIISVFSAARGIAAIPAAQVVGSNIANILLIVGATALLAKKFTIGKNIANLELPIVAAVLFIFVLIAYNGTIQPLEGVALLIGFGVYTTYIFRSKDNRLYPMTAQEQLRGLSQIPKEILIFIATAVCIAIASHFVVTSTATIASVFSVSEGVIAITVLALGTSLPELVVSIQAALRNEIELVIGNVIGSNIFNILFVIGASALFSTLTVNAATLAIGIPTLIGATALFAVSGISKRIRAWEGLFYILLYAIFIGTMVSVI